MTTSPDAVPLSDATLAQIAERIPVPTYDRSAIRAGIVHVGVGGFHRAHQAMYLDRLMNQGVASDWGIVGVGVMPADERMRDAMKAQDCLTTVVVKHPDGSFEPRVTGAMIDYLWAPEDPERVLAAMTDPAVRIVSLTVTEGGYHKNAATGEFDPRDEGLQHDLQPEVLPRTAFGLIVEALARRRAAGIAPFTVMSCDNVQGNGHVARASITAFARLRDPDLADWMTATVRFPDSMVDRITPFTSDADRALLTERYGVVDAWPVVCEPFEQWVLEDAFGEVSDDIDGAARPPLEDAGVQLVTDVGPYELMKLRLLNAGHQSFCYLGVLAGHTYAHDVTSQPLYADFVLAYMNLEATPTMPPVPGVDLDAYKPGLIERFSNPQVRDTLARLCSDTSDRIPTFMNPVVRYHLEHGGALDRCALVYASWARYCEGVDEQGTPIDVVDRVADRLRAAASRHAEDPLAFLRDEELFGDLAAQEDFTRPYLWALESLRAAGARATLEALAARR